MTLNNNRPTSPHLQVYKLPLTGLISITHRMTGVLLSVGLVFLVYILWAMAGGEASYQSLQNLLQQGLVRIIYWGFVYALFFHLCHGIRHLLWDMGRSFERDTLTRYAIIELCAAFVLTLITFVLTG
jgi:succinate dehydrogenase / fumarate reductase, cytochrome b subunit